jgi:hypothetical protein
MTQKQFEAEVEAQFVTALALELNVPESAIDLDVSDGSEVDEGRRQLSSLTITYTIRMPVTPALTPAPTRYPSVCPTYTPSVVPTDDPTVTPTDSPTSSPSSVGDTVSPTHALTAAPTGSPTALISASTHSPTMMPTTAPTASPTHHPTDKTTMLDLGDFVRRAISAVVSSPESVEIFGNARLEISNTTTSEISNGTATSCKPGTYAAEGDCKDCLVGHYQPKEGRTSCDVCKKGGFQPLIGAQACLFCEYGTYQMNTTSIFCNRCQANMVTENEGSDDVGLCVCAANFYLEEIGDERICKACPEGADCSTVGSTVRSLNTSAGYWRASTTTVAFHKCADASACIGGLIYDSMDNQCNLGHVGLKCGLCDWSQQYVLKYGVSCEPCAPNEGRDSVLMCFVALLSAPIAIYIWLRYRAVHTGRSTSLRSLKELVLEMVAEMQHALEDRSTIFKISVGFIQVLTRLGETYRLRFPVQVTFFFNCMQFLEFLDVFSFSSDLQCAHRPNHLQKIVVTTAGSMLVLTVLVLMSSSYVSASISRVWQLRRAATGRNKQKQLQVHPSTEPSSQPGQTLERQCLSDFLVDRSLATPSVAKDRWFRAYNYVVLELYQTGLLNKNRIHNPFKRAIMEKAVKSEKRSVWNLILLFTFMIYPSCNSILMSWFDCELYEDGKSYLVVDPQIVCSCEVDAVHPVTLLASDMHCDTTVYNNTVNKWYVGFCTLLFVGGIPAMYAYILRSSKQVLDPRVGIILRDGKKQQQQFELLRSRVGYRKAVQLVKLKARDINLIASRTKFLWWVAFLLVQ